MHIPVNPFGRTVRETVCKKEARIPHDHGSSGCCLAQEFMQLVKLVKLVSLWMTKYLMETRVRSFLFSLHTVDGRNPEHQLNRLQILNWLAPICFSFFFVCLACFHLLGKHPLLRLKAWSRRPTANWWFVCCVFFLDWKTMVNIHFSTVCKKKKHWKDWRGFWWKIVIDCLQLGHFPDILPMDFHSNVLQRFAAWELQ